MEDNSLQKNKTKILLYDQMNTPNYSFTTPEWLSSSENKVPANFRPANLRTETTSVLNSCPTSFSRGYLCQLMSDSLNTMAAKAVIGVGAPAVATNPGNLTITISDSQNLKYQLPELHLVHKQHSIVWGKENIRFI